MMTITLSVRDSSPSIVSALAPLMAAVLIGFLVIGAALPVLPLHVRDGLGFGPVMVGIVAGCQFAAALIARIWAGQTADTRGSKWAVMVGLLGAALAGVFYLLSLSFLDLPAISIGVLLAGRAVLGGAESFIITGATTWGLARLGAHNSGKVIAWMGTAMFAAFAAGAPLGTALYDAGGFGAISSATIVAPLLTLIVIAPLRPAATSHTGGPGILSVASRIWLPGLGAALSSVGFGAIVAFGSLLFANHGWMPVWLAFSAYAVSLIVARMLFGHLPDQIGGATVALLFVLIEAAGLALMFAASGTKTATLGAALTGFGYSLVFPALGVEAVGLVPPASRGAALSAYSVFLDLSLGITGPLAGYVANLFGYGSVFLFAAIAAASAVALSVSLHRKSVRAQGASGAPGAAASTRQQVE